MISVSELSISLLAGSLSTLNPCVFPLLPLVLGGAMQSNRLAPVAMGVGMAGSFAFLGLLIGALGDTLGLDPEIVRNIGGTMLVLIGVAMLVPAWNEQMTKWMTPLASNAQNVSGKLPGTSLLSAFLLGAVLGFVWSPCSGPLLLSAMSLVATEGGLARGAAILGVFGLGAAIPLVVVAYASRSSFMKSRDWLMKHINPIKRIFALLILGLGMLILTGYDKTIEAAILEIIPDSWVQLTTRF